MPVKLTDETWNEEITNAKGITLVDVWAPWCGPCLVVGPIVEEIATDYAGKAKVGKLNADENRKSSELGITGIPTLLFFKDGQLVDKIVGAVPKQVITDKLDYYLSGVVAQS